MSAPRECGRARQASPSPARATDALRSWNSLTVPTFSDSEDFSHELLTPLAVSLKNRRTASAGTRCHNGQKPRTTKHLAGHSGAGMDANAHEARASDAYRVNPETAGRERTKVRSAGADRRCACSREAAFAGTQRLQHRDTGEVAHQEYCQGRCRLPNGGRR